MLKPLSWVDKGSENGQIGWTLVDTGQTKASASASIFVSEYVAKPKHQCPMVFVPNIKYVIIRFHFIFKYFDDIKL